MKDAVGTTISVGDTIAGFMGTTVVLGEITKIYGMSSRVVIKVLGTSSMGGALVPQPGEVETTLHRAKIAKTHEQVRVL